MNILDALGTFVNQTITIYPMVETVSPTTGEVTRAPGTAKITINAMFFITSKPEVFFSDKIQSHIDGIFTVDYSRLRGVILSDADRILMGSRWFNVIAYDDIALQHDIYIIGVKEIK